MPNGEGKFEAECRQYRVGFVQRLANKFNDSQPMN
jgi:hypothetical protein